MLIVSGKPELIFGRTIIGALKELAGPYSVSYGAADAKKGWGIEIRAKGFSPDKHKVGWTVLNTLATSKKKVEIYESTEDTEDGYPNSHTNTELPNICRISLNLSPFELLVWADEAKRTTKWEIAPPYIILGHELFHAFRWVLGKSQTENLSFVKKISPYTGELTLPDGKKVTISDTLIDYEKVGMAGENRLREEARSRGANIGYRAAYSFGRNPKTQRVFKIGHK